LAELNHQHDSVDGIARASRASRDLWHETCLTDGNADR
jgi:hypothetical protein